MSTSKKRDAIISKDWNRLPDGTLVLDEHDLEYIDIGDPDVVHIWDERFVVRLFCKDEEGWETDVLLGTLRDPENGYFDAFFCREGCVTEYGHVLIDQLYEDYEHIEKDEGFIFVSGHELDGVVYIRDNYEEA